MPFAVNHIQSSTWLHIILGNHLCTTMVKEPMGKSLYVVLTEVHGIEPWCLAKKLVICSMVQDTMVKVEY